MGIATEESQGRATLGSEKPKLHQPVSESLNSQIHPLPTVEGGGREHGESNLLSRREL